jgi:hypothetical protein
MVRPYWYPLAIAATLSGCVTVNEQMLPKRDTPPPVVRGLVEYDVGDVKQLLNGETSPGGLTSSHTAVDSFGKGLLNRWKSRQLIDDYGHAGELKSAPAYRLTLSGDIKEQGSILGAVATGLTLYLIPSSSTMTYDLTARFTHVGRNQTYTVPIRNGSTTWMQILLLPALPFGWMGASHMIEDTADYLYSELHKQGAFDAKARSTGTPDHLTPQP